jgi:ATP-binding protein involved in chromosome partitioning
VEWGALDYLLVDMPPGTGRRAALAGADRAALGRRARDDAADVSAYDVTKAIGMFRQVNVEILGIVENMAGFLLAGTVEGAKAGTRVALETAPGVERVTTDANGRFELSVPVFGRGRRERLAKKHGFPVLGRVPLNPWCAWAATPAIRSVIANPTPPSRASSRPSPGASRSGSPSQEHRALPVLQ